MPQTSLAPYEWIIISLFCAIFLVLAGFAIFQPRKVIPPSLSLSIETIPTVLLVKIEGEVKNPGTYHMPLKSTIKNLLDKAQLLEGADVSQLNPRRSLRDEQKIHVPKRKWMTIQVCGAVEKPGEIKILSGTRYCEFVEQLHVKPEADLKTLHKKKRFLQEGETVEIPSKKNVYKGKMKKES